MTARTPRQLAQRAAAQRRHAARHPDRVAARAAAGRARRRAHLVHEPCQVCGSLHVEAHHPEYAAPLAIRRLCPSHHREEHIRIRREAGAARLSVEELLQTVRGVQEPICLPAAPSAPRKALSSPGEPLQRLHEVSERGRRP